MLTVNDIDLKCRDEALLLDFILREFKKLDENITPLKILSKFGVSAHDQQNQLKFKNITNKIKAGLLRLEEQGILELKDARHGTLGIKEKAYKLKIWTTNFKEFSNEYKRSILLFCSLKLCWS